MKIEYSDSLKECLLVISEEEMRALYDSLDRRMFSGISMNVAEHKLYSVMREIVVGGETGAELDELRFNVAEKNNPDAGHDG